MKKNEKRIIVQDDIRINSVSKEENSKNAKDELFRLLFNKDFGDKSEEYVACELRNNLSCGNGHEYDYEYTINNLDYTLCITKENIILYCVSEKTYIQNIYSFNPGEYDSIRIMAKQMRAKYKEE